MKIAIAFAQFGPYHVARVAALARLAGGQGDSVEAVEVASESSTYGWTKPEAIGFPLTTLVDGRVEDCGFLRVFFQALKFFRSRQIDVALLPSYSPASSFALLCAAKCAGCRTVMLNESHAGTERATGIKHFLKRFLVAWFDAGLVGGTPHVRHFAGLGMRRLFTGYDAVDNEFFAAKATEVRADPEQFRERLRLPGRYILSLGRLVPKKNLGTLIRAYARLHELMPSNVPALVIVGSGEEEPALRVLAVKLNLAVVDHTLPDASGASRPGAIHFYGFRQIDENPVFYALADCFVLPSLYEEWGLVVNEAMACGIPVVVSKTAGCAEDLVEDGGFDPLSADELAGKLARICADARLCARMGERSFEIISRWGCDNFAKQAMRAASALRARF